MRDTMTEARQIAAQFLTESLILAAAGGVLWLLPGDG